MENVLYGFAIRGHASDSWASCTFHVDIPRLKGRKLVRHYCHYARWRCWISRPSTGDWHPLWHASYSFLRDASNFLSVECEEREMILSSGVVITNVGYDRLRISWRFDGGGKLLIFFWRKWKWYAFLNEFIRIFRIGLNLYGNNLLP